MAAKNIPRSFPNDPASGQGYAVHAQQIDEITLRSEKNSIAEMP